MFKLGVLIIAVWIYCFFYYDNLPLNVSFAMMLSGLFTMGWGLLSERKK